MKTKPEPAERVLVLTRLLDAPRHLVFQVWTQPQHLTRWWGPNDFTLPHCEVDFSEGGKYKFCMHAPDGSDHWVWGVYEEIVAPERLVFSWHRTQIPVEIDPWAVTRVTVTFAEQNGKTLLTLHQAVFPKAEECSDHHGGWTQCLDRLVEYVARSA
jgi:uncharacterized protein YndB with AHSA1/START domain